MGRFYQIIEVRQGELEELINNSLASHQLSYSIDNISLMEDPTIVVSTKDRLSEDVETHKEKEQLTIEIQIKTQSVAGHGRIINPKGSITS